MWRSYNALVFFVLILGETAWGWNWSGGVGDLITYDCIFLVNLTSTVHDLFLWVMIACLVTFWPYQLDYHSTRPYTCSSSIFWLLVNLTAVAHDFFAEGMFAQAVFFGIVVNLTATVHDFFAGLEWVSCYFCPCQLDCHTVPVPGLFFSTVYFYLYRAFLALSTWLQRLALCLLKLQFMGWSTWPLQRMIFSWGMSVCALLFFGLVDLTATVPGIMLAQATTLLHKLQPPQSAG